MAANAYDHKNSLMTSATFMSWPDAVSLDQTEECPNNKMITLRKNVFHLSEWRQAY